MRGILLALLTIGGFGLAGPCSAQTATQYPYCIQGEDNPGWSGCSFNTLQECQRMSAGTYAECLSNPWYKASNSGAPAADGSQPGANAPAEFGMAGSASVQTVTQYPYCIPGPGQSRLERLLVQLFPRMPGKRVRHGVRMPLQSLVQR